MKHLFVFGTRPEAIKMAPLIQAFKNSQNQEVVVCVTGQHREMLDQVLTFFEIVPDFDLNLMTTNQGLSTITTLLLDQLTPIIQKTKPDNVFVQGDTTSAFVGALASFYFKISVSHIEAGLRSFDFYSPFPEEVNRKLISKLATYHFAPTKRAVMNLNKEGINKNVFQVGNTVIDALFLGLDRIKKRGESEFINYFGNLDLTSKIILVTCHRRESFGIPLENICRAIKEIAEMNTSVQIVFPVHLNPNVQNQVRKSLSNLNNVILTSPLPYPYLIWIMSKSYLILTDSGGIQEEGPALGKPVLVMRDVTERIEGIEAGTAKLVGTDGDRIKSEVDILINNSDYYKNMANAINPYGDGNASKNILNIFSGSNV